ncbi:hypothetical protein D3C72_1937040 [compost metagenome]
MRGGAHFLLGVVEPFGPMAMLGAGTQRLLGFTDARGTGAQHHGHAFGTVTADGIGNGRRDLRQGHVHQRVVAATQGHRQCFQRRQRTVHFAQRQGATWQQGGVVAQPAGRIGKQRSGHRGAAVTQRADHTEVVEKNGRALHCWPAMSIDSMRRV